MFNLKKTNAQHLFWHIYNIPKDTVLYPVAKWTETIANTENCIGNYSVFNNNFLFIQNIEVVT